MKSLTVLFICLFLCAACQEGRIQRADEEYDVSVSSPSFTGEKPVMFFDEGHNNFHTSDGLYKPFVSLLGNDGFEIIPLREQFSSASLEGANVLVIANAMGTNELNDSPAFEREECAAVSEWVAQGGSLLLIADHFPFGPAAQPMASVFGVSFHGGLVSDSVFFAEGTGDHSQIVFSRANGHLKDHPVTAGIEKVVIFSGQSLLGPPGSSAFLKLSSHSYDLRADVKVSGDGSDTRVEVNYIDPKPALDKAVGIALNYGKGKVVVLGEAAMLTAQRIGNNIRVGMNSNEGNRLLALNIMHWLVS